MVAKMDNRRVTSAAVDADPIIAGAGVVDHSGLVETEP